MFSEAHIAGILFPPIITYCLLGALVFVPVRAILGRIGLLQWLWHTALFELALYVCITGAIILFVH